MSNAVEQELMEMVDHPKHYQSKHGVEAIDVIEEFNLDFHLGNVVKYILRAGHKNLKKGRAYKKKKELEDLKKARWYLDREIARKEIEND